MAITSKTTRFRFLTYAGATEALLLTLENARETDKKYRITGLTPESVVRNGLLLEGEIDEISEILLAINGVSVHDS